MASNHIHSALQYILKVIISSTCLIIFWWHINQHIYIAVSTLFATRYRAKEGHSSYPISALQHRCVLLQKTYVLLC